MKTTTQNTETELSENPRPEPMLTDPVPSQPAEQPNRVPVLFNQPIDNNVELLDRVYKNQPLEFDEIKKPIENVSDMLPDSYNAADNNNVPLREQVIEHDYEPVSKSNENDDEDEPLSNYKVPKKKSHEILKKKEG